MKLLAFTDLHGDERIITGLIAKAKKAKPDLLVCAGDISEFGAKLEKILKKFESVGIPMILIPGNHEDPYNLKKISSKFEYIIYLNEGSYELDNYVFFGYGDGVFNKEDKYFERLAKRFAKAVDKNKKFILLVHAPPYKTKLDLLPMIGHSGNKSIKKFIVAENPHLVICGHLHENFGKIDKVGKRSILVNPGPKGKIIEI
jgi:uncharacterized protein